MANRYAIRLAKELAPLGLKWMEEYLIPVMILSRTVIVNLESSGLSSIWSSHLLIFTYIILQQDDYAGHATVYDALREVPTLLATGEHEYTRYGFKQLIECGVDVLQPDVTWCGGITEARRIITMAAALDLPVIPHGSSVFSCESSVAAPTSEC